MAVAALAVAAAETEFEQDRPSPAVPPVRSDDFESGETAWGVAPRADARTLPLELRLVDAETGLGVPGARALPVRDPGTPSGHASIPADGAIQADYVLDVPKGLATDDLWGGTLWVGGRATRRTKALLHVHPLRREARLAIQVEGIPRDLPCVAEIRLGVPDPEPPPLFQVERSGPSISASGSVVAGVPWRPRGFPFYRGQPFVIKAWAPHGFLPVWAVTLTGRLPDAPDDEVAECVELQRVERPSELPMYVHHSYCGG